MNINTIEMEGENLLFSIKEIYSNAHEMKYYEFENWLFEQSHRIPPTVDKSEIVKRSYIQIIEIKQ